MKTVINFLFVIYLASVRTYNIVLLAKGPQKSSELLPMLPRLMMSLLKIKYQSKLVRVNDM